MAETVVLPHSDSQPSAEVHASTKRPVLNAQSVRDALPYIDSILAILAGVPTYGAYAQALRVVTTVSVQSMPNERRFIVLKMRSIKDQMRALDVNDQKYEMDAFKAQLDVCVELLIELES